MTNEHEFDPTSRNENGVKCRLDCRGDAWANQHRQSLNKKFYIQDVDVLFGVMAFGHNTGDQLFLEYVPDNYKNRENKIRRFGVVAIFDRKETISAAFDNHNKVSMALHLWLCRSLGMAQPKTPKFFFVFGGQLPPWEMMEIDVESGEPKKNSSVSVDVSDWREVWEQLGLIDLRNEIVTWLNL